MYGDVAYHDISIQSVDRAPAVPCEIAMRLSSAKLEDMLRKKKKVKMKDQTHGLRRDDGQARWGEGGRRQRVKQLIGRQIEGSPTPLWHSLLMLHLAGRFFPLFQQKPTKCYFCS